MIRLCLLYMWVNRVQTHRCIEMSSDDGKRAATCGTGNRSSASATASVSAAMTNLSRIRVVVLGSARVGKSGNTIRSGRD
ncbi:Protein of unknown function [Gryllus bimaculatus]|nr:Protein of unknown function [Gryllus bimaculatus]